MKTISNKTPKPISVPLPRGKKLHLGPGKTGQIASNASEHPPLKKLSGKALYWAKKSLELDLDDGDQADEDTLNRILWHATRGYDVPYPEEYAGKNGGRTE